MMGDVDVNDAAEVAKRGGRDPEFMDPLVGHGEAADGGTAAVEEIEGPSPLPGLPGGPRAVLPHTAWPERVRGSVVAATSFTPASTAG